MKYRDQHIEDLLFDYFAGELSDDKEEELVQWLKTNDANQKIMAEMADWWATAHVPLFRSDMKSDFEKHFGEIMQPKETGRILSRKNTRMKFFKNMAASVAILLSISAISFYAGTKKDQVADEFGFTKSPQTYAEIITPKGSTSKVVLPDGSVVWVNAGSTLKYGDNFNKSNREISLLGEAYFDVMPDQLKPFIVKSENLNIKVTGTSFNVKAYPDDEEADVSLVTGSVNILVNKKETNTEEVLLVPDQKLSFNRATHSVEVVEIIGQDAMAWTNGQIKFTEQSFTQIAKDLERKFDIKIRIESEKLKNENFSGSFTATHTIDQILKEVDVEKKYTWFETNNEIIISDKKVNS